MQILTFALLSAVLVFNAGALQFQDCGSKKGSFSAVHLSDCDPAKMDFCPLKRKENVTIDVDFSPNEKVESVKVVVHGYIAGIPMPFSLPNPNGCSNSGLTCPIAANSQNKYTLSLPIKNVYPRLYVSVQLELVDQANEDIVCIMIPAKIV